MTFSTHVLDTATGTPAEGVVVDLAHTAGAPPRSSAGWAELAGGATDADGRLVLLDGLVPAGTYRLRFDLLGRSPSPVTPAAAGGGRPFFPEVSIVVSTDEVVRLHVPLLLSPFGYTTYRGS